MPSVPREGRTGQGPRQAHTGRGNQPGVWFPWPELEAVCQLNLRPPSLWPVFLAVLGTSRRYGGRDARLEVGDLTRLTGLSRRTVQAALGKLMALGLVVRVDRYGVLRVNLPGGAGAQRSASLSAPPGAPPGRARGADKVAPRRRKLACASPTSTKWFSCKPVNAFPVRECDWG
jgi:hypothetical protein